MKLGRIAGVLPGNLSGMRQYADIDRPAPPTPRPGNIAKKSAATDTGRNARHRGHGCEPVA